MKLNNLLCGWGMILAMICSSCQVKGMYVAKNGLPVPYNMTLMKKSARDTQDATGPGYTYHSETIDGDETIFPKSVANAYLWGKVAKHAGDAFKSWSGDKAKVDVTNSNNALAGQKAALDAATQQKAIDAAAATGN